MGSETTGGGRMDHKCYKSNYEGEKTTVKLQSGNSREFEVKVGVRQESVLSPLLFIIVLEALSRKCSEGLPWDLFYADDLALLAETENKLKEKLERWQKEMEAKGLRVNMGKTKIMHCQVKYGQAENSGKWPCGICKKGVEDNSIQCTACMKWIHKNCSDVKGKLSGIPNFKCRKCINGEIEKRKQR